MKKNLMFFFGLLLTTSLFITGCGEDEEPPTSSSITVTGTISDDAGTVLEGVAVSDGASASATSAADGTYSITVSETATLTYDKDGYDSGSESVNSRTTIDVTLNRGPGFLFAESFGTNGNQNTDPGMNLASGSIAPTNDLGAVSTAPNGDIEGVNYKGAVNPSAATPWYAGWSSYASVLGGGNTNTFTEGTIVDITDATMTAAGTDIQWTNDKTYVLDGFVFVNDGQTLTIQEGTVIKGKPGEAENASALIVAQGGKIMAVGTAEKPIIFTAEADTGGGQSPTTRGLWGGVIILGKAGLNSSPGTSSIEGLPTNEPRGAYGGTVNDDNSGTLKYVSIRHGGTNIGDDNEINGLTLGGVGTGTAIDYVEILANKDDGIEWFGGTANAKHLLSIFCGDDALDYDEGYRGNNQFIIIHQDSEADAADRGGEHDGGTDPETGVPYATPTFFNVTSIGNPGSRTITFRDNAGGNYHNSIFYGYGRGIDIEDLTDADEDSYKQWQDGNLKIANNVFFNIGSGTAATDLFTVSN